MSLKIVGLKEKRKKKRKQSAAPVHFVLQKKAYTL